MQIELKNTAKKYFYTFFVVRQTGKSKLFSWESFLLSVCKWSYGSKYCQRQKTVEKKGCCRSTCLYLNMTIIVHENYILVLVKIIIKILQDSLSAACLSEGSLLSSIPPYPLALVLHEFFLRGRYGHFFQLLTTFFKLTSTYMIGRLQT